MTPEQRAAAKAKRDAEKAALDERLGLTDNETLVMNLRLNAVAAVSPVKRSPGAGENYRFSVRMGSGNEFVLKADATTLEALTAIHEAFALIVPPETGNSRKVVRHIDG
jgi:hypothetical protein